jgi:hypothetical protein
MFLDLFTSEIKSSALSIIYKQIICIKTESSKTSQKVKTRLKGLDLIEFECLLDLAYFHQYSSKFLLNFHCNIVRHSFSVTSSNILYC